MTAMQPLATATSQEVVYPAYAALDRVASIAGVPLLAGLAVFVVSLMVGMVGGAVLGPIGLALGVIGLPVLLWLRVVCETDDQALRIVWLEVRCAMDRRNAAAYGGTYTLCPVTYGRRRRSIIHQVRRLAEPCWMGGRR